MVVLFLDTMNEQFEINFRQAKKEWQAKQNSSGLLTMTMCVGSAVAFLNFLCTPDQGSAMLLGVMIIGLLAACVRMLVCASKIVDLNSTLQPVPIRAEVIDVEVVDAPRRNPSRQLNQYTGNCF